MIAPASLDLAVVGNCDVAALIDRAGAMVWACWPRFDSDPEQAIEEVVAQGLKGHRGRAPVRIGNAARDQIQHDFYGSVMRLSRGWGAAG